MAEKEGAGQRKDRWTDRLEEKGVNDQMTDDRAKLKQEAYSAIPE